MLDPAEFSPIRHLADLATSGQKPKRQVMPYTVPSLADFGGQNCAKALAARTRLEEAQQGQTIEKFLAGDFDNQNLVLIKQYTDAGLLKLDGEQVFNFLDDLHRYQKEEKAFNEELVLGIISKTINETNVNYEDQNQGSLLSMVAGMSNHQLANKLADILLNAGANPSPHGGFVLPLAKAIENQNTELIKKLSEHPSFNINAQNSEGNTVLHNCGPNDLYLYEDLEEKANLIKLVLNLKPDLSICNNTGETACEYWQGHDCDARLCALLDPEAIFTGLTIFEEYCADGLEAIRSRLTGDDIDKAIIGSPLEEVERPQYFGSLYTTLLSLAIQKNDLEAAKVFLKEYGAKPNLHNAPLLTAVLYGNLEMVQLLLDNKANPDLITRQSWEERTLANTTISLNIENLSDDYQIQEAIKAASKIRPDSIDEAQDLSNALIRLLDNSKIGTRDLQALKADFEEGAGTYSTSSGPYLGFAATVLSLDYGSDYNPEADLNHVLEIGIRAIDGMITQLESFDMDPEWFAIHLYEKAVLQNQSTRYSRSDIEETLDLTADYAKQANPVRHDILNNIIELRKISS